MVDEDGKKRRRTRKELEVLAGGDEARKLYDTPQFDPRFPQQNQSQNCFINYVDYYRCLDYLPDKAERCEIFKKIFTSLCPNRWVERWDELRDKGIFPHPIVRIPNPAYEKPREKECEFAKCPKK